MLSKLLNYDSTQILYSIIIIIIFLIVILFQFFIPYLTKISTNSLINNLHSSSTPINNSDPSNINMSPTRINDIYLTILYSFIIGFIIISIILVKLLTPIYKTDSIVQKLLNFILFEMKLDANGNILKESFKPYSSIMVNYFTFAFLLLIILYVIQIYRYINNLLINSSNSFNNLLSTYSYGYDNNAYKDALKNNKFDKQTSLNINDYNSIIFTLLGIMLIIIIFLKFFILENINLNQYYKFYWTIFLLGGTIYFFILLISFTNL